MLEKEHPTEETNRATSAGNSQAMPALGIDWDYYMRLLEDSDAPDEQKRELIETLWNIVVAFVDLGFGVHPIQQASDAACGQNSDPSGKERTEVLNSATSMSRHQFSKAVSQPKEPVAERNKL